MFLKINNVHLDFIEFYFHFLLVFMWFLVI